MKQNWAVLVTICVAIVLIISVAVLYTIRKRYAYDVADTHRLRWYENLFLLTINCIITIKVSLRICFETVSAI